MFYDTSKAKDQLGYDPGPLDAAIRDAIRWFAENGYLLKRAH
jgi:nucleoside-diphosphate-sugar epimerase